MAIVNFPNVSNVDVPVVSLRLTPEIFRYSSRSDTGQIFSAFYRDGVRGRFFGSVEFKTLGTDDDSLAQKQALELFFNRMYDDNGEDLPVANIPVAGLKKPTPATSAFGSLGYRVMSSSVETSGVMTANLTGAITGLKVGEYLSVDASPNNLLIYVTKINSTRSFNYTPPHEFAANVRVRRANFVHAVPRDYDVNAEAFVYENENTLQRGLTFDFVENVG